MPLLVKHPQFFKRVLNKIPSRAGECHHKTFSRTAAYTSGPHKSRIFDSTSQFTPTITAIKRIQHLHPMLVPGNDAVLYGLSQPGEIGDVAGNPHQEILIFLGLPLRFPQSFR